MLKPSLEREKRVKQESKERREKVSLTDYFFPAVSSLSNGVDKNMRNKQFWNAPESWTTKARYLQTIDRRNYVIIHVRSTVAVSSYTLVNGR